MKREVCPSCGGVLVAESLGWKCKSCRGFISLQDGKFYEYAEKPFMPPQTNADRIRAMSDEELAEWLVGFFAEVLNANTDDDWDFSDNFRDGLLKALRQPVKDGEDE